MEENYFSNKKRSEKCGIPNIVKEISSFSIYNKSSFAGIKIKWIYFWGFKRIILKFNFHISFWELVLKIRTKRNNNIIVKHNKNKRKKNISEGNGSNYGLITQYPSKK